MIYLHLAVVSFLSLASLRMLRDYYFSGRVSNGRYFGFCILNLVAFAMYSSAYEISCGKGSPSPGEVTAGETMMALFPTFLHLVAGVDALKATR